ncbi:MAG: hypothetical protein Q4C61_16485 [Lachnospiraceae bacterium]|nr:hypothetical protein [Lachnospiraceae bacterium]
MRREEIYRELTKEGKLVCALAGMVEEIVVFLALRIQFSTCPLPVMIFLWFLFAVLTAAAMIVADELRAVLPNASCE